MFDIFTKQSKIFIFFISLLASFSSIKTEFEEINLKEGYYSKNFNSISEMVKFRINPINDYNYVKVLVEGKNEKSSTNHIISFYQQDESLNERKQLSQGITNITIMWLIKEQINKETFLTVECAKTPCDYQIEIKGYDTAEIFLDEQYKYYITKENQQMKFKIKYNSEVEIENVEDYNVSVCAYGNKKLKSELNRKDIEVLSSNYSAYRVTLKNLISYEYILTINGEIGDFINIGILCFKSTDHFLNKTIKDSGIEVIDYIKKREGSKFNFNKENLFGTVSYINGYKTYGGYNFKGQGFTDDINYYSNDNELFYNLLYLTSTKYDGEGNNKISPQLLGINIDRYIEEGTTIGIIPQEPEKDFNYLIYQVFPLFGEVNVSVYECENYPLCHLDNIDEKKLIKFDDIQTYFYSYSRDEWKDDITTISKKQNMLLITCNKGRDEERLIYNSCGVSVNMKTEKNIISLKDFDLDKNPNMRFIRKNEENKYLYESSNSYKEKEEEKIYLNVAIYSGKIELNSNKDYTLIKYEKIYIYTFNATDDLYVTIKGIEDSIYILYNYYNDISLKHIQIGSNYLYKNFEPDVFDIENNFNHKHQYRKFDKSKFPLYLYIFPVNCSYELFSLRNNYHFKLFQKPSFLQDLEVKQMDIYTLLIDEKFKNDTCLIYSSFFLMDNRTGILMAKDFSQSFLFDQKKNNNLTISYYHIKNNNNVDITLDSKEKKENFNIVIYLNNVEWKKYNFELSAIITIKSDEIKDKCKNSLHICKITLFLQYPENKQDNETIIDIVFNENEKKEKSSKSYKNLIIILSCVVGIIIIIIILTFVLLNKSKKYKDLKDLVNNISFNDDRNTNENQNDLLE